MFARLARGAAAAGLAAVLCTWFATPSALAGTGSAPARSGHPGRKAGPPPLRPGPLPEPVRGCLGEHGSPAPSGIPWAQQALDYQGMWQFSEGQGVTVAVIDSGVDDNPQFDGRVIVGPTLARAQAGPPDGDCVGHGTSVAGIIAAAPVKGVPFAGVAPEATILSIKVTNTDQGFLVASVSRAIVDAVQDGAQVINLSLTEPNTPELSDAINYALSNDVVVVASAGNDTANSGPGPFYPAAYPGVLSVGAVDSSGNLGSFSNVKTPVTVTAPGVNVTSTFPGVYPDSYLTGQQGTSFATAFVSGVAALVRARYPQLPAAKVVQLIKVTADGAAGPGTGNGLVNPVQALTAVLSAGTATTTTAGRGHVAIDKAAPDGHEKAMALSVTAGALGAAVLVLAIAAVIPAGRRRRWRPGGNHP